MDNIKIVRLHSGEDIICNYYADKENDMVMLDKPMHIIFKKLPTGKTVMMMMPWLPLELIKENSAIIDACDILTTVDPREELIQYYMGISFESDGLIGDEEVGNSLLMEEDELDDEEQELDIEEIQELMKERKKVKLH